MQRLVFRVALLFLLCLSGTGHGKPERTRSPLTISQTDVTWGSRLAGVTIVQYMALQSPFSALAHRELQRLKKEFGPTKLRIVYRALPVSWLVHNKRLAHAALAVYKLRGIEGFEAFIAATYKERANAQKLPQGEDPIDSVLKRLGWGKSSVVRMMNTPAIKQQLERQMTSAKAVRAMDGKVFLNGMHVGFIDPNSVKKKIENQGKKASKLRAQGMNARAVYDHLVRKQFQAPTAAKPKKPAKAAPAAKKDTVWKLLNLRGAPVRGARNALVTMVVYSDLQCPFCKRADDVHKRLLERYGNELRIVFKHYPLPFHRRAKAAHNFAMAAFKLRGNQGFWKAQDALLRQPRRLEDDDLQALAKSHGLPVGPVMAMVRKERFAKTIEKDIAEGRDFGVRGTPHHFINGRKLGGARNEAAFATIIDEEIIKARKLLKRGVPASRLYATLLKDGRSPAEPEQKSIPAPTGRNPSRGPRNAKIVIQMFSDFQCPYCARVMPTIEKLMRSYPNQIRLVFRHRPLSFHRNAPDAHATALEAFRQGGNAAFWRMYSVLQAKPHQLKRSDLVKYTKDQGLDAVQLRQAWASKHHDDAIKADVKIADTAGISGTPAFVINGYYLAGAQPYAIFKRFIDKVRTKRRR